MEGLGAAASVVAVASIAIQIGDSALKLKKFVDSIKDAPEELKLLIGETNTLICLLSVGNQLFVLMLDEEPRLTLVSS